MNFDRAIRIRRHMQHGSLGQGFRLLLLLLCLIPFQDKVYAITEDLVISGQTYTGTETKEGLNTITVSDTSISSSGNVTFRAGQTIDFKPGFSVEVGGFMKAETQYPFSGTGTGLIGEYYDNRDFTNLKVVRLDETIDIPFSFDPPDPSMGGDHFSIIWKGFLVPEYTGTYTIYCLADDTFDVKIGNETVLFREEIMDVFHEFSGHVYLVAGKAYEIVVRMTEDTGAHEIHLKWEAPPQ